MLTQSEFEALLQRYLDGRSRPGEQQQVERWSAQLGQQQPWELPESERNALRLAMWQRIEELTQQEPLGVSPALPALARPLSFWQVPAVRWAAAAACVLSLGTGWLLRDQHGATPATVSSVPRWVEQTNNGLQVLELRLADGSRVALQPGSGLRYSAGLTGPRREVYLTGQGFFKVAKNPNRPFLVFTDRVLTTVLGTSFTVSARAGQPLTVAVREGRVAVQPRQNAQLNATPARPGAGIVLLLPNQQAVYSETEQRLTKELVANPTVLVGQKLEFKNRPVAEVLAALEKSYGVNIVYDPAKLRKCTVTIALDDDSLFEQLTVLCKALGATYKLADDAQIIFEGHSC